MKLPSVAWKSLKLPRSSSPRVGVRLPPAANRSTAVEGVHSENQFQPPPSCSVSLIRYGDPPWNCGTRPPSAAPVRTRSPRVSMRAVASPSTSNGPPPEVAAVAVYTSLARDSLGSMPPWRSSTPPTAPASMRSAPRRLVKLPLRSRRWTLLAGKVLASGTRLPTGKLRSYGSGFRPPPMRISRSPPPVCTSSPDAVTRPVLATARFTPWLRAIT